MKTILITERIKSEAYLKQEKTEIVPFLPCGSWLNHGEWPLAMENGSWPLMEWGRSIFCLSTGNGAPFCKVSLFLFLLPLTNVQVDSRGDCLFSGAAAAAKLRQLCPTLCDPIDGSPPGSPVPGILQARTLEWVAISFSNAWKWKVKVESLSRVRLCTTPWTTAPPGSSVHRIFQARVLEWVAIALW